MFCPKCHQKIPEDSSTCPYCKEEIFSMDRDQFDGSTNHLIKVNNQYVQYETKMMKKTKTITLFILLIYTLLVIGSMFLPLLTYVGSINADFVNILSYINFGNLNIVTLIQNLTSQFDFESLQGNTYLININLVKTYNILSLFLLGIIILVTLFVLIIVIKNLIRKTYSGKYKLFIGMNTILSLILLLGFSFDGVGNLFILSSSILVLIWFFVSEIISREKRLKNKTNLIKLSLIFLFGFVVFSVCLESMYILDGSQDLIPTSFVETEIVSGNPFTQIVLQFIAINSFDGNVAMTLNILLGATLIISIVLICLASVAFVSLLKGFSNQNARIPIKRIWICVALIIAFVSFNYVFCSLANDSYYAKALSEALKNGEVLSVEESNALKEAESYFQIPSLCVLGCIVSLPVAIYATIAKKLILKVKE